MRNILRLMGCAVIALTGLALPEATSACSSPKPTAAHAARQASHIVLARVLEVHGPRGYPSGYRLDVIDYLKGAGDRGIEIEALVSSLCEDRISTPEGSRAVIAFDVEFRGRTLAPYWVIEADDSVPYGDGIVPSDDWTLDDLIAAIEGALPDTAAADPSQEPVRPPSLLFSITALLGALAWIWRRPRVVSD